MNYWTMNNEETIEQAFLELYCWMININMTCHTGVEREHCLYKNLAV